MKKHKFLYAFVIFVMLVSSFVLNPATGHSSPVTGSILYVDVDATGGNNGTSWEDAYTDLQPALEAAVVGDEIWVAAGTYLPTEEQCGEGDRYKTFQLKNGVGVYGGFDPSIGDVGWEDRDWENNVTILSGDLGVIGDNTDNSYHVFCHPEELSMDSSAVMDGFTIADGGGTHATGAGMINYFSSPSLINVTFFNNNAIGMFSAGGGMYNDNSSPTLTNVTFNSNTASKLGGGMYNISSSPELTNVTITNCSAEACGGMYNNSSSPILNRVTFSYNSTLPGGSGGGLCNNDGSDPILTNVTFNNNAAGYGGGMSNGSSSPILTNVTFFGNAAINGGGALANFDSPGVMLTNSISWGNTPDEIYNFNSSPDVTYSDIQGGYEGTGNIDSDPLLGPLQDNGGFVLTHALGEGSPAIDTGNPDPATCPPTDARGQARPQDGDGDGTAACDMGAYEYLPVLLPSFTIITSDNPDPSLPDQPFTATFEVTSTFGIPTGVVTVTLSESTESCNAALVDGVGSCSLVLSDPGDYTLIAEYSGNEFYLPNTSPDELHRVEVKQYLPIITR